jgi:Tol biopolymer transport system component
VIWGCTPPHAPPPAIYVTPTGGPPDSTSGAGAPLQPPDLSGLATATAYAKLPGGQIVPQIDVIPANQISQQYPGLGGHLLYFDFNGLWDYPLGGEAKKIFSVEPGGYLLSAAWSPDAAQVAFSYAPPTTDTTAPPTGSSIYLMQADGSNVREVIKHDTPSASLSDVIWSPDGQWLYFSYYDFIRTGDSYTYTLRLERAASDGTQRQPLVNDALMPALSADGQQLAFLHNDATNFSQALWVANADGQNAHEIVPTGDFYALNWPRFSPDGKAIVFAGSGPSNDVPRAGSQAPVDHGQAGLFDWFDPPAAEAHGLPWDLYSVNVDGSGLKALTSIGEDQPAVVFSRDGRYLIFHGAWGIYVMLPDGSQLRRLTNQGGHSTLDWHP